MRTVFAIVIAILITLIPAKGEVSVVVIPPMPDYAPTGDASFECMCDECCYDEAYLEYANEFTALFNSYEYKVSKNGRSMINGKFVAMPKKGN